MLISTKDDEFEKLPEGKYLFKVKAEPDGRKKTSPSTGKTYKYFIFKLDATNEDGAIFTYSTVFVPWGKLWRTLLLALGGIPDDKGEIHLSETEVVGKEFYGTVEHQVNPKDPEKIIDKIVQIESEESKEDQNDDVPF